MKVISDGFFDIYVYANEVMQPHHIPHCHVLSANGDTVVSLPDLGIIVGKPLSRRARKLALDYIDEICESWNKLNPELTI
jgi:hypothetical protein